MTATCPDSYVKPATGETRAPEQCVTWDPAANITWSFNSGTKTHTVQVGKQWLQSVFDNGQRLLLVFGLEGIGRGFVRGGRGRGERRGGNALVFEGSHT